MPAQPKTILCIDDEIETLRLRRRLLEMSGYAVITALSGADGMRYLAEGQAIDLVLLDYAMPGMAGDRVAEELKLRYPQIPIVVVSGFVELPERTLSIVDGYVRKGQDPEVVMGAITTALAQRQS
jgi:CheY-like chemotaxis protein